MTKSNSAKNINKIYSDKTSGSAEILSELHEHLKGEIKMLEIFPVLFSEIETQFKSFQSVQSYLKDLESYISKGRKLDGFFKKYDSLLDNVYINILGKNKKVLSEIKTVVTISNSKTVFEILKLIGRGNNKLKVSVCESRPKFEGRILSNKLITAGIETELIIEADAANKIKSADAVMVGADIILKNGDVINKTGSLNLAIICNNYSIPFYVIADKSKFSSNNKFEQKEMPPEEIWRHKNSSIKIKNLYFEKIDKKYITKILTS